MNKHTDGPWEWTGPNTLWGGERGMEEVLKATDDGKPFGLHSALIEHHWDSGVAKANQRLIAAAPELLEALEVARRFLRSKNFDGGNRDAVAFVVETAIAKALGE